jgi:hypothetical protein
MAVEHCDGTHQFVAGGRHVIAEVDTRTDGQRISQAHQPGRGAQLRDQDGGVEFVPVAGLDDVRRRHDETAAPPSIQQPTQQRLGIEAG